MARPDIAVPDPGRRPRPARVPGQADGALPAPHSVSATSIRRSVSLGNIETRNTPSRVTDLTAARGGGWETEWNFLQILLKF